MADEQESQRKQREPKHFLSRLLDHRKLARPYATLFQVQDLPKDLSSGASPLPTGTSEKECITFERKPPARFPLGGAFGMSASTGDFREEEKPPQDHSFPPYDVATNPLCHIAEEVVLAG